MLPKDYVVGFLAIGLFHYHLDDEDVILKLAVPSYTSSTIKKIEKQNGSYYPRWVPFKKMLNYDSEHCALMYASDELLHNKKFILKYIDLTSVNPKVLEYVPNEMKRDKVFLSHALLKGYQQEDILNSIHEEVSNSKEKVREKTEFVELVSKLELPERKKNVTKSYTGSIRNWDKSNQTANANGARAEEMVLDYEVKRLISLGREDLANQVRWVSKETGDGVGYDILSYDAVTGQEMYIEVKSSIGNKHDRFELSQNEFSFACLNPNSYFIYWIVGYPNRKLYIIPGYELIDESYYKKEPSSYTITPIHRNFSEEEGISR